MGLVHKFDVALCGSSPIRVAGKVRHAASVVIETPNAKAITDLTDFISSNSFLRPTQNFIYADPREILKRTIRIRFYPDLSAYLEVLRKNMDLKHILNPMPESEGPLRRSSPSQGQPAREDRIQPAPPSAAYFHTRQFLVPRRLDPETASVSSASSSKRRRTNRGRVDVDRSRAVAMGRTFSEIEPPSDTPSSDDEQEAVKHGVSQLSISGIHSFNVVDFTEHGVLKPGMRVEALKSGTQGTWYVARIVEFASFPQRYLDGDELEDKLDAQCQMVCVHYEGIFLLPTAKS